MMENRKLEKYSWYVLKVMLCTMAGVLFLIYHTGLADQPDSHQKISDECHRRNARNETDKIFPKKIDTLYGYPKVMHRVYGFWDNSSKMSPEWMHNCYKSCHETENGFHRIVWNLKSTREFLQEYYPWFVDTFNQYPYPVQRADVARYFILHHYGGLYLDMDHGCNKNLPSFYEAIAHKVNKHTSPDLVLRQAKPRPQVSNVIMLSKKCDPYMMYLISSLESYNTNYWIPYATVMFTTGPGILSHVLSKFKSLTFVPYTNKPNSKPAEEYVVYEVPDEVFTTYFGSSGKHGTWHSWDAFFILSLYKLGSCKVFMCFLLVIVLMTVWLLLKKCRVKSKPQNFSY